MYHCLQTCRDRINFENTSSNMFTNFFGAELKNISKGSQKTTIPEI